MQFSPPVSPGTLVFQDQLSYTRSEGNLLARVSNDTGVGKNGEKCGFFK